MKVFTWKQRVVVIGITTLMVCLFAAVGYGIGLMLGNWKFAMTVAALASYPFTQWTLIKAVRRLYDKENGVEMQE